MESRTVTQDVTVFSSHVPLPGLGLVPVNAYLLKARQPALIDTGMVVERDKFLDTLRSVIDPQELHWIFLTHPHPDHIGSVAALMQEVPHLRLVTTFLAYGLFSLMEPIPLDRIYLLNPGETLDLGDREIASVRPPTYDDPSTTGYLDTSTRVLFSSDSFGALLQEPAVQAEDVNLDQLLEGQRLWTSIDSPWLHNVDRQRFAGELKRIESLDASWVLSSHLPPAKSMTATFLKSLAAVPDQEPWVGPNQAALEAMLAQLGAPSS